MKSISPSPQGSFVPWPVADRRDDQLLRQVHHRAIVAVGLVNFEHGELGVVPGVNPLVAIDATQLVHPLDPADQQPLQVQFQRDPQKQVDVQRVVVGGERAGGRPAGNGVQRRPLDLDKPLAGQRAANRLHDLRPPQEPLPNALAVDQIDIAHPLPHLGIGQPLVLCRRRLQRFAEEVQRFGEDRQFAGPRAAQFAVDADQIAQVETLRQGPTLLADLPLAEQYLQLARPVADVEEDRLAGAALEHDAAGGADLRTVLPLVPLALGRRLDDDFAFAGANPGDGLVAVESLPPGVEPELANLLQLLPPRRFQRRSASRFLFRWFGHGN